MGPSRSACLQRSRHSAAALGLAAGLTVGALAACSSPSALHVPVPTGAGAGCARLHHALPSEVDGRDDRDVTPKSARTAAWGSPAVVLRCGVPRPAGLTRTSELVEVNGVAWFLDERDSAYVFTTTGRRAYVQVRVPSSVDRSAATAPLVDLAPTVKRALPEPAG
jgi:hypothetical protein